MSRAVRLRYLRSLSGMNRRQFCAKYNISYATLSLWENLTNPNGLSIGGAEVIIKSLLDCKIICALDWLMFGYGPKPGILELQVQPRLDLTDCAQHISNKDLSWYLEDNNMAPEFPLGTTVFFKQTGLDDITDGSAYLTVDSRNITRFSFVQMLQANLYLLYDNTPGSGIKVKLVYVFLPEISCY